MKTIITATAALLLTTTAAFAGSTKHVTHDGTNYGTGNNGNFVALPSPTNGTNGTDGTDGQDGATGTQGDQGDRGDNGQDGTNGHNGVDGADGTNGTDGGNGSDGRDGIDGTDGATGSSGSDGVDGGRGAAGSNGVAPLGSLSFAAATSAFSGDGMGFGLSNSNYGSLEGSVVFGFDLDNDWRVVAGITTDFNGKVAGSIGVGVSF